MKTRILIMVSAALFLLFRTERGNTQTVRPYFNAGPVIPMGKLSSAPNSELATRFMPGNKNRIGELVASGGGGKTGFSMEAGALISVYQGGEGFGIDLLTGITVTQMDFDWTAIHPSSWNDMFYMKTKPHRFYGLKIGPAILYEIDEGLGGSLSYSLHPTIATNAEWKYAFSIIENYWMDELIFNLPF